MATAPYLSPEVSPDRFTAWSERVEETPYYHRVVDEHHVALDGIYLGLLHWSATPDKKEAFIDGIDGANREDIQLLPSEWEALATYMNGVTKIRRITCPAGTMVFLEAG